MRISDLSRRTGVSIDTIRFYEKRGLLNDAHFERGENGYRAYRESAVERLELIKGTQAAGFSLSEIAELFEQWEQNQLGDDEILARLRAKREQVTRKIEELMRVRDYLDHKLAVKAGAAAQG